MIGTFDQERMRSTTSEPSVSGKPRSIMRRSTGCRLAARIASAPLPASTTEKPLSSKPVRKNRRICTSSSTTRTMGPVSLIGFTFHNAHGRKCDRQFDLNAGAFSGARAVGGDIAAIGGDKRRRDPETEARAFGGGD